MINYLKSKWYDINLISLGKGWLYDIFSQLEMPNNFYLLNAAANNGIYEKELYNHLYNQYDPVFDIGDICGKDLYDKHTVTESEKNFTYYNNNCDALEFNIPSRKYDCILDIKGAIWHACDNKSLLKRPSISDTQFLLLKHYLNLLKDDNSLLIIDSYQSMLIKLSMAEVSLSAHYRKKKINYFTEASTYEMLEKFYFLDEALSNSKQINTIYNPNYPLTQYMSVLAITKKSLAFLIDKLEKNQNIKPWYKRLFNKINNCSRIAIIYGLFKFLLFPSIILFLALILLTKYIL